MLKDKIDTLSHRIQTLTEMISENCKHISDRCRHDDTRFNYGLENLRGTTYSRQATMNLLILLDQTSNELRLLLKDPDFYWGNQLQVVKE